MLGVLQDALRSFFQYRLSRSRIGKRIFREACDWIWIEDQHWLYSFENICGHLQLDPDYIRQGLRQYLPVSFAAEAQQPHSRPSFFPALQRRPFHLMAGPGSRLPSQPRRTTQQKSAKAIRR
jgi:hypothetical protein